MSFAVAGCGDDTTGGQDGSIDLSVSQDLRSNADIATGPDLQQPLATAQLTLADIGGTFYKPGATAGSEQPAPFTHILFSQQSVAMFASNPQYIDSDFSGAAGMVHGCTSNRYNQLTGPFPNFDVDAGIISYKGYSTALYAADANTPPAMVVYNPPIPDTIHCAWGGATLPFYGCIFGNPSTDMKGNIEGESPLSVVFPAFPVILTGGVTCPAGTDPHSGPFGPGGTTITLCEQHPIATGATLTENLAGGSGYGALSNESVPLAGTIAAPMTIINVAGAAPANPADPFGGVVLDGSADLTVTWSCDGSTTPGMGCPSGATGILDLAGFLAIVSTNSREKFGITQNYGTAQCAEQLGSGTVTLKKAAITQMLGGQTGGSALLALVRLSANPTGTMGHTVFFTGGKGYFGLVNH
ncbi:MAG TPA: hypothetical protein VFF06_27660 [Polyangia bacterium]|nr:hypothetical protein [Polyangia bacterium]